VSTPVPVDNPRLPGVQSYTLTPNLWHNGGVPARANAGDVTNHFRRVIDMSNVTHLHIDVASWTEKDQRRFDAKIKLDDATGCWLWTGSDNGKGYGRFKYQGVGYRAHRLAWTLAKGPIPDGLQIDHLCRVRGCVNPDHMEPVDNRTNTLRGDTLPAANAAMTHCANGHELSGGNLSPYSTKMGYRRCLTCERNSAHGRYAWVSMAAKALGITVREYRSIYGSSVPVAERIVAECGGER